MGNSLLSNCFFKKNLNEHVVCFKGLICYSSVFVSIIHLFLVLNNYLLLPPSVRIRSELLCADMQVVGYASKNVCLCPDILLVRGVKGLDKSGRL